MPLLGWMCRVPSGAGTGHHAAAGSESESHHSPICYETTHYECITVIDSHYTRPECQESYILPGYFSSV
jgi:hypothetical protein